MKKLILTGIVCLGLSGCEISAVPRFENMSYEELAEYNQGRNLAQMIVCSDDNRTFSRIRRRRCMTVEAMYGSAAEVSKLQLLHTIPGMNTVE